jgi:hypothetical protein
MTSRQANLSSLFLNKKKFIVMYKKIFIWVLRLVVALISLQILHCTFTGAPESIYVFETIVIEPFGRIGSGIIELIDSVLIQFQG